MDVMSAIEKRREITRFRPDPISQGKLDNLLRSLYLSPSGNNLLSREFILVTGKETLQELAQTTPYMKWLHEAAAAVVILGRPDVSKYWLQDASIAGGYAWLAAVSAGLGAAWGAVYHAEDPDESKRREDWVREKLDIPPSYRIVAILGFGYPAAEPPAKDMVPMERVIHREKFQA